jgi:hypothetical protein
MKLLSQIRGLFIRIALLGLPRRKKKPKLNVFVVPTSTVMRAGVEYVFDMLNSCQEMTRFIVTDSLEIRRTNPIQYSPIEYIATIPKRTALKDLAMYISQFDFCPQADSFLRAGYGAHKGDRQLGYVSDESLAILIGREKFVWDDPSPEYALTGDFNEDGYTILYNNDTSNYPNDISKYNNIAAMSLTKLTALPEIDSEVARSGDYENIFLNARAYIVSNTVHFLAERLFASTMASEHVAACILNLNWTGGLISSLASREFCSACRDKMHEAGTAFRAGKLISCDEVIGSLERMVRCLDRIEQIKQAGNVLKLSAWGCFTMLGVSLILGVVGNYTNDVTFATLLQRYAHPLEIAAGSAAVGLLLLAGFAVCSWISPGKRVRI